MSNEAQIINTEIVENELSISQIVTALIKEKNRFIKNCLRVLAVWLIGFLIYSFITYSPVTYYSIVLGLNFPQAAQGKYPNGTTFNPSDIISNSILEKVWTENELDKKGIDYSKFQNSFTALPFSGEVSFAEQKYKNLLSQKNLSRADIEKIESDFKNEIQAISSKNIKLTLDSKGNSYDLNLASKLLNDVASEWSKAANEKLGVTRAPQLDGVSLTSAMKASNPYSLIAYLNDIVIKLKNIIVVMQSEPSGNSFRDPETKLNLSGLSAQLQEISKYEVDELDSFITVAIGPTGLEISQTEYKIKDLESQKTLLDQEAASYRRAFIDYTGSSNQIVNSNTSPQYDNRQRVLGDGNASGMQLNGDAITKLFSIAQESKDSEFRQDLTSKRIIAENKANELTLQITKMQRRLNSVKNKSSNLTEESKLQYNKLVEKIFSDLGGLIGALTRIQTLAQKDYVGTNGLLYSVTNQASAYKPSQGLIVKAGASLLLAVFLSFIFTLLQIYWIKISTARTYAS